MIKQIPFIAENSKQITTQIQQYIILNIQQPNVLL